MFNSDLQSLLLLRILIPLGIVIAVIGLVRIRGLDPRENLGWKWPSRFELVRWTGLWIIWIVISEVIGSQIGISIPEKWVGKNPLQLSLMGLGMVFLAPLAEEMVFRGILFAKFRKRFGNWPAVVGTAVIFAALHLQYDNSEVAMILCDGFILGYIRLKTGSVPLTFFLHAIGNLVAYLQRFPF